MSPRSGAPTEVPASTAQPRRSEAEPSCLPRAALAYAARCHVGQRSETDGAPFIEHLSKIARLLRDAGCSDVVIAAGLLHRVGQYSDVSPDELRARFGTAVGELVGTMSDDCVGSYSQRKVVLREQVRRSSGDAALLFAAAEIAEVQALADEVRRERPRRGAEATSDDARRRRERYQRMRLENHRASLTMLRSVRPGHRLVKQLAGALDDCPITLARRSDSGG